MASNENFAMLIPTFNSDDDRGDGWGRRGGYYGWYSRFRGFRDGDHDGYHGRFYRGGHDGHYGRRGRGGDD
jgi:hypothetical protein